MTSNGVAISHDHSYCGETTVVDSSNTNDKQEETKLLEPHCLSPTYSNDSGIDSFAQDLAQEFSKENQDLFNFLLDDQGLLEFGKEGDKTLSFEENSQQDTIMAEEASAANRMDTEKAMKRKAAQMFVVEKQKKNAENARENRKKKKAYVSGLETEVEELRTSNTALLAKSTKLEKRVNELEDEVVYLKSVIDNESMLSKLLEKVSETPGISLSTSLCSSRNLKDSNEGKENSGVGRKSTRKRGGSAVAGSPQKKQIRNTPGSSGGVCLHVKNNKVSLEFCRICSKVSED